MNVSIVRSKPLHAFRIRLRACDLLEGNSWVTGQSAAETLSLSISHSTEAFTAFTEEGDVIGIFGYSVRDHHVTPWLMCSDHMDKYTKRLLRTAHGVIDDLLREHPGKLLCNHVARGNQSAKRFLQSLGFRIMPSPGMGEFEFFFHPKSCVQTPLPSP